MGHTHFLEGTGKEVHEFESAAECGEVSRRPGYFQNFLPFSPSKFDHLDHTLEVNCVCISSHVGVTMHSETAEVAYLRLNQWYGMPVSEQERATKAARKWMAGEARK
jgi:hypothetical protein